MTAPFYADPSVTLFHGDCLTVLADMPDASVDAVVTDPPYEINFMARSWDRRGVAFDPDTWRQVARVLKPGGHMLAFGGDRTWHRLVSAIEDAGFEIRHTIAWIYASGFPKSHDVAKAITAAEQYGGSNSVGIRRARLGEDYTESGRAGNRDHLGTPTNHLGTDPTRHVETVLTEAAKTWHGWGTALKPAHEPIILARKPLAGTVAANVLAWGTGALNIDGCKVATTNDLNGGAYSASGRAAPMAGDQRTGAALGMYEPGAKAAREYEQPAGRWPPNLVLTHAATPTGEDLCADGCVDGCPVDGLDRQTKGTRAAESGRTGSDKGGGIWGSGHARDTHGYTDTGASRFFPVFRYQAKAPASERPQDWDGTGHPTVKPLELIRWLCKLVTPPGGLIADPFCGSGTTGEAAVIEGFRAVLVEQDEASCRRTVRRLSKPIQPVLDLGG